MSVLYYVTFKAIFFFEFCNNFKKSQKVQQNFRNLQQFQDLVKRNSVQKSATLVHFSCVQMFLNIQLVNKWIFYLEISNLFVCC